MSNKLSLINKILFHLLPSISIKSRSLFSPIVMIITVFILLVAYLPCISSSPTPNSISMENNKIIDDSNAFMYDQTGLRGDSSVLSSSVHDQKLSSSPFLHDQPRTHANQFLMSHVNDNNIIVPKWFTRFNDDDDNINDYAPADLLINKRSSNYNNGGYQNLKKRKQLTKPPMEVMNEIVNSIYLKR